MKRISTICLPLLAIPLLSATLAPGDTVAYRPASGTKVARNWSLKQDLTLDEMDMTMNDQPMPIPGEMSMDMSNEATIEVTDVLVEMEGGKPTKLRRTYDKLGGDGHFAVEMAAMPNGGMDQSLTSSSELEGKTVAFTWNADESKYDRAFHESEGEEKLLEHLDEDMDLRAIAPGREVAAGDTWTIDVKQLRALLMPGGDVGVRPDKSGDDQMDGMMPGMDNFGDMSDMLGDMLEGEATAEYQGLQDVEGGKYGVIKLKLEIQSNNDMADKLQDMLQELPDGMGEMTFDHMDVEFGLEGEGTVLWDTELGMIRKVDLSGKVSMSVDVAMQLKVQGREMAMEQSMTMSGTIAIKLDVTKE